MLRLLRALAGLYSHTPLGLDRLLAAILAWLWFDVLRIRRRLVVDQLLMAGCAADQAGAALAAS